jgi:hypothetical protein
MAKNPKPPQDDADLRSDGVQRRAAPSSYSVCSTGSKSKNERNSRKQMTESRRNSVRQCSTCLLVLRYGQNSSGGIPFISMYSLLTMLEILHYEEAQKEKRQSDA